MLKASNGAIFRAYPTGSYFGEIELLDDSFRSSAAQVSTKPAELLTLSKKNLETIFSEFPEIKLEFTDLAKIRKKLNKDAMEHVLKLEVSGSNQSLNPESESESEPEQEQEEPINTPNWLLRKDTGVLVSHMTISPNKVKNLSKWSKAVKETQRTRSVMLNQDAQMLIERQRSMKKQASLKFMKNKKLKLQMIRKAMKVEPNRKSENLESEDFSGFDDELSVEDFGKEEKIRGIFGAIFEMDEIIEDRAEEVKDILKKLELTDKGIIEDFKRLEDILKS